MRQSSWGSCEEVGHASRAALLSSPVLGVRAERTADSSGDTARR